jgi:hypothetical protein
MKYKTLKLSAILLLAIGLSELKAQETIATTGGNANGTGGSVSYSVGQVVFTSSTGTSGSVTAGVQQPYEISVLTGLEEDNGISLVCSAYPNPTTDLLTLRIEGNLQTQYTALLYNTNGSLLKNVKIETNETRIDMRNLVIATYFLKIVNTTKTATAQEVKTFKIIKK